MKPKITTHLHWKNIAKMFGIVIPVFMSLLLLLAYLEIPPVIATIFGIFIGCVIAEYCSRRWELWHFTHKYVEDEELTQHRQRPAQHKHHRFIDD